MSKVGPNTLENTHTTEPAHARNSEKPEMCIEADVNPFAHKPRAIGIGSGSGHDDDDDDDIHKYLTLQL